MTPMPIRSRRHSPHSLVLACAAVESGAPTMPQDAYFDEALKPEPLGIEIASSFIRKVFCELLNFFGFSLPGGFVFVLRSMGQGKWFTPKKSNAIATRR